MSTFLPDPRLAIAFCGHHLDMHLESENTVP